MVKTEHYDIRITCGVDGLSVVVNGASVPNLSGVRITCSKQGFHLSLDQMHALQAAMDAQFMHGRFTLDEDPEKPASGQYL